MPEPPLKTAILGLDEPGRFLLEATRGLDYFKIVAVADSDSNLAQQFGKLWNCASYDDYRQLITQNKLDCLFVAAPLHTCADYLNMAIKKKFNIFKLPPFARNYSEAAELDKLSQAEGVTFTIANLNRFAKPALAMRNFILQNSAEQFFFILAGAGMKKGSDPFLTSQAKWRGDPVLAGGGVLLYDCWETIDQIVQNFGVPQQVYCVAGSTVTDSRQRLYLTEDSAVVTLKFSDFLFGTLLAGRSAEGEISPKGGAADSLCQTAQNRLTAQGQNLTLKVDGRSFEAFDKQGEQLKREDFEADYLDELKKAVENFGSNLLWPDQNLPVSSVADNLKNMAVIEAAYLSARTGMPEQPARMLQIA
jgi:predicted dehydrogenase